VDPRRTQHMAADQLDERRKRRGTGADPVGQGRDVEIDPLAREALALPVERQVAVQLGITFCIVVISFLCFYFTKEIYKL
jgi:hypothetical protein